MLPILLIALATTLLVWAIVAKVAKSKPEKASKSEKAEILKQLLALSGPETAGCRSTAPVPLRTIEAKRAFQQRAKKVNDRLSKPTGTR